MTNELALTRIGGVYTIHRLPPDKPVQKNILAADFYAIVRTTEELSVVCPVEVPINNSQRQDGWVGLKVEGPLDFDLKGILAGLTTVLAHADVSVYVLSSYDTDYLFVRSPSFEDAVEALRAAGYRVTL